MPECIICRRKVLVVDQKGLCGECRAAATLEVATRLDTIYLHYRTVQGSDDFEECLKSCDLIIKEAEALLPYEKLEIEVAPPLPSEIIDMMREIKDDIIMEEAERLLQSLDANTAADSSRLPIPPPPCGEVALKLQELKSMMSAPSRLADIEREFEEKYRTSIRD